MSSLAAPATLWEFGSSGRHGVEILGVDTTQSSGPSTAQGLRDQGEQSQDPAKSLNGKALRSRGRRLLSWVIIFIVVIVVITVTASATAGCCCITAGITAIVTAVGK